MYCVAILVAAKCSALPDGHFFEVPSATPRRGPFTLMNRRVKADALGPYPVHACLARRQNKAPVVI